MKKLIAAAVLALGLAGCQHDAPTIRPELAPVPMPKIQSVKPREVQWKVYTAKDLRKLAADMEKPGHDQTIIALTPQGYKNLSYNMTELERYMREQKEALLFMKSIADERGRL